MLEPLVRATPFHVRAAAANRENAWANRNGVTLSASYGDTDEALAARTRVAISDISWRWRVMLEGARVVEFLAKLVTRNVAELSPGMSLKALWLSDDGGVRGAGVVARYGKTSFLIAASAPDLAWIETAARAYDVTLRDVSETDGGLAIIGPYAHATVETAGLAADLVPLQFRKWSWRGIEVTLSRFGEHGGFEIWCAADDGLLVWDRISRAGEDFRLAPAGLDAMDILDLEAGIARPGLDYMPSRDGNASSPNPAALGLETLIDDAHHTFNGRSAYLAAREAEPRRLVGIEFDSEIPAPFTPLVSGGRMVGHTLRSVHSPALRRAIALAQVDAGSAKPGTVLTLTLPPSAAAPELRAAQARVVPLPFLPVPDSIPG
jgi:aminomethyltransferase